MPGQRAEFHVTEVQKRQFVEERGSAKRFRRSQPREVAILAGVTRSHRSFPDEQHPRRKQQRERPHHHALPLTRRGGPLAVQHAGEEMADQFELDAPRLLEPCHACIT